MSDLLKNEHDEDVLNKDLEQESNEYNISEKLMLKEYVKGLITGLLFSVIFISSFLIAWNYKMDSMIKKLDAGKEMEASDITLNSKEFKEKLTELKLYIGTYFLEDTDESNLAEGAFKGVLASLNDPYSTYYTAEEYKEVLNSTEGEYEGIGIAINNDENNNIVIKEVYDNTPAKKAGIQENDIVLKIDDNDFRGKKSSELVEYIRNIDEDLFSITVDRDGEEIVLTVSKKKIETPTVLSELMDDNIGYIALKEFDGISTNQFSKAINELNDGGMKKLIIDLRNNPGGRLDVVCDLLDLFVDKDKMLVYTKDKYGEGEEHISKYDASIKDIPICVLVNGKSASASEVFTGVMKDYGLATVVGEKTFGKGIVQRIISLGDGSAMKLTVSKYYLPNDENIHGEGITPDVEVSPVDDSEMVDEQLEKAIELVK